MLFITIRGEDMQAFGPAFTSLAILSAWLQNSFGAGLQALYSIVFEQMIAVLRLFVNLG